MARTYHSPNCRKNHPGLAIRFPSLILFVSICFLFSLLNPALAAGSGMPEESFSQLKKGKELLDQGKYIEAADNLRSAYSEIPLMRDYVLFFMARAHNRMENFDDSARCLDELLGTFPDSPLKKKARTLQIRNLLLVKETAPLRGILSGNRDRDSLGDAVVDRLEAYAADYPDDAEMMFLTAGLLKKLGKNDRAKRLFLVLYSGNSSYSEPAYKELQPSDITPEHGLTKASNLMKATDYKKAEELLRKILPDSKGALKEEIQKAIGLSLFRQKRYKEAGEAFLKTADLYNGARALYRAGNLALFRETVSRLVSMEDKRAGSLLLAYAAKKRREGRSEEALNIYADVKKKYPSLAEDALWGMAWTHYRSRDCKNAAVIFSELNERFPATRYLYWSRQCADVESHDETQAKRGGKELRRNSTKDYYSLLSYAQERDSMSGRSITTAGWTPRSGSGAAEQEEVLMAAGSRKLPADIQPVLERSAILMDLGMKDDAVMELVRAAGKISGPEALMEVCRKLQDMGAYKRSIALISRYSGEKGSKVYAGTDVDDILYPLAYWPTVRETAAMNKLDPFILLAVMREESRFDPDARSIAGALGLMQIMPHTAFSLDKQLKMAISDNSEIYDIKINLTIGAYYLSSLLREFGSLPPALAAYNAGHERVREWIKAGDYRSFDEFVEDIPFDETRNYVKRVLVTYLTYLALSDRL